MSPTASELHRRIAEQDLPGNRRTIDLHLNADGSLRLEGGDVGSQVEEVWGDSDYEFWVDIPASAVGRLAFALLAERLDGDPGAVDALAAFCQQHAVPCEGGTWV
ncbi:MAG: hypothetical protein KDE15_02590 [Erythrobacter sp.]|nr:hypothetical protein [Erythrobacter sp.]